MSEIHLLYTSQATVPLTAPELEMLAHTAKIRNQSWGITGVLLYGGGHFLQLLEGRADAVESLYYDRIVKDTRHTDCRVLLTEAGGLRLFPGWSMGRLYLQDNIGLAQQSWIALCVEIARQNPEAIFARDPAVTLIEQFIRHFGSRADQASYQINTDATAKGPPAMKAF